MPRQRERKTLPAGAPLAGRSLCTDRSQRNILDGCGCTAPWPGPADDCLFHLQESLLSLLPAMVMIARRKEQLSLAPAHLCSSVSFPRRTRPVLAFVLRPSRSSTPRYRCAVPTVFALPQSRAARHAPCADNRRRETTLSREHERGDHVALLLESVSPPAFAWTALVMAPPTRRVPGAGRWVPGARCWALAR